MAIDIRYSVVGEKSKGYLLWLAVMAAIIGIGLFAAHHMELEGHHVTGMNNRIVWGLPHVFAIFLIVAASGALNVASVASVFGNTAYKPLARLSALLAISLLSGGLIVLVLDLGRPERLIVAMTHYNFKSIFTWNIFLYNGFMGIVAIYLFTMFERRFNDYSSKVGTFAFVWRIILTTGTGSIFGFLVARQTYDAAIMAPLFVALSLSVGTAVFLLVLTGLCRFSKREIDPELLIRITRLMGVFAAAVLYLALAFHLTALYATEHHGVERYFLLDGGIYTSLFWFVQIAIGTLAPLALIYLFAKKFGAMKTAVVSSVLVIIGAFAQLYVVIIGGQAYPLVMFPGMEVISNGYLDSGIAQYIPSLPEFLLGLGGIGIALIMVSIGIRVLPFVPDKLTAQ